MLNSHSGRTDSDGGHYNHKTGKYHYHNGKSNNGLFVGCAVVGFLILRGLFKSGNKK